MNKEVADKWAGRLLKRADFQGRSRMKTGDLFCALGELCELHRIETGQGKWEALPDGRVQYVCKKVAGHSHRASVSAPPPMVREWAGIRTMDATYEFDRGGSCVMSDNDSGVPFPKIAAKIVKHYQSM